MLVPRCPLPGAHEPPSGAHGLLPLLRGFTVVNLLRVSFRILFREGEKMGEAKACTYWFP